MYSSVLSFYQYLSEATAIWVPLFDLTSQLSLEKEGKYFAMRIELEYRNEYATLLGGYPN